MRGSYAVSVLELRPAARGLEGKVDQLFAELDQSWTPGAAVVVLDNGKIVHINVFGMADLEGEQPLTARTPINICSIGKQLTAFAIALLADQNQLNLDDDIRKHLSWVPDFGAPITIRHLIHHTSGLRELDDLWALSERGQEPFTRGDFRECVKRQQDLNFAPGEQYLYCNTGYVLLGEIVEQVTGVPFIDWMNDNVLQPLGMNDTFIYYDVNAIEGEFAWSYYVGPNGQFERYEMVPAWYVGAGNVFTTAEDFARWLLNLEDPWICSRRIVEQLAQPGPLNSGEVTTYAFAQDRQIYRGVPVLEHGGGGWGYRSYIMRFPEFRFATLVVSNFVYGKVFTRARDVTDLYLGRHFKEPPPDDEYVNRRRAVAVDPALLDGYTGIYRKSSGRTVSVTRRGDQLFAEVAGLNNVGLYPDAAGSFFIKESGMTFAFDGTNRPASAVTVFTVADTSYCVRVDGTGPETPEAAAYLGSYFSPELEVSYTVESRGGRISLRFPKGTEVPISHVHDDLYRGSYFTIEFDRDEESRITGFRVSCERSLDIRFRRH